MCKSLNKKIRGWKILSVWTSCVQRGNLKLISLFRMFSCNMSEAIRSKCHWKHLMREKKATFPKSRICPIAIKSRFLNKHNFISLAFICWPLNPSEDYGQKLKWFLSLRSKRNVCFLSLRHVKRWICRANIPLYVCSTCLCNEGVNSLERMLDI